MEYLEENVDEIFWRGLRGRVLRLPAKKSEGADKEFLFIYGSHSSIERNYGIALALSNYGNVTFPDLPGMGGMDSLYKIGMKPSFDSMADYLADFVRSEYKGRRVRIVGFSLGEVVAARMLQRHPDITPSIYRFASISGFTSGSELQFTGLKRVMYLVSARLISTKLLGLMYRYTFLSGPWLRRFYPKSKLAAPKFAGKTKQETKALLDIEVRLWHENDVRTWAYTTFGLLTLDGMAPAIDTDVWHVSFNGDQYANNELVISNMDKVFARVHHCPTSMANHSPTLIDTEEVAAPLLPDKLIKGIAG